MDSAAILALLGDLYATILNQKQRIEDLEAQLEEKKK